MPRRVIVSEFSAGDVDGDRNDVCIGAASGRTQPRSALVKVREDYPVNS